MHSRGKLVQDWRRRLAAAEADGAEGERRTWLAQMRLRLYRFLLSCYQDADWRADEPSTTADETLADVACGDTTTLLDVRLDGKPAKSSGKMQAVLKSVSAAQDHPAKSGPLLGGIAADEWVVVVSVRDKLKMAGCQELLEQFGISTKWKDNREINVRLFDLDRAIQIIRENRASLIERPLRISLPYAVVSGRMARGETPGWAVRAAFVGFLLAPLYALTGLLFIQCGMAMRNLPLLDSQEAFTWLLICYFIGIHVALLTMYVMDWRRFNEERKEARRLAERIREMEGANESR
jgi:hypothetical protein